MYKNRRQLSVHGLFALRVIWLIDYTACPSDDCPDYTINTLTLCGFMAWRKFQLVTNPNYIGALCVCMPNAIAGDRHVHECVTLSIGYDFENSHRLRTQTHTCTQTQEVDVERKIQVRTVCRWIATYVVVQSRYCAMNSVCVCVCAQ